jgi:hypothetical protein
MNEARYEIVFDPCGRVDAERVAPAPRVAALDGLRLGILDNAKWNAGRLLRKTAAQLGERFDFAAVNYYRKESFSRAADPALIAAIAADNDIVLTAIGD